MSGPHPNAQQVLVEWLRSELPPVGGALVGGLTIGTRVPEPPTAGGPPIPIPLMVVRRIGGTAIDLGIRDNPTLDVLIWHASEFNAEALAQVTRDLIHRKLPGAVIDGVVAYRPSEVLGPTRMPDPAGGSTEIVMFTFTVPLRRLS